MGPRGCVGAWVSGPHSEVRTHEGSWVLVEGVVWGHMQDKEHMEAHSQSGDMGGLWGCVTCRHPTLPCSASWAGVLTSPET